MADWRWLDAGIPRAALSASPEKILSGHTVSGSSNHARADKGSGRLCIMIARHRGGVLALVLKGHKEEAASTCGFRAIGVFLACLTLVGTARR